MRKLDFFRLPAPAAMPAHLGAGSLKKSNFLMFSKVLRNGADQANCVFIMQPVTEVCFDGLGQWDRLLY